MLQDNLYIITIFIAGMVFGALFVWFIFKLTAKRGEDKFNAALDEATALLKSNFAEISLDTLAKTTDMLSGRLKSEREISAKEISLIAAETIGWNKNTTYTVIKKLEAKGFIRREDPGFICTPLISQNQMQKVEAVSLVKKVFGGSRKALFSALLEDEPLSDEEIDELRKVIDNR